METIKEYDVTVESGIIAIFQSQTYKLERVMAEFIDNSLQNFLDHEKELSKMTDGGKCNVSIIWDDKHIIIRDNAFGMTDEEFGRALKLKAFNPRAAEGNRLSVYGMGLKYAAVYLGNHYAIDSSCYGAGKHRHAEIDVPTFEKENPKTVPAKVSDIMEDEHGTVIEITSLRAKRTDDKEKDLRDKLGVIYHYYIQPGILTITVNGIPVHYQKPELRKNDKEGGTYFEKFESAFDSNGVTYSFTGWVGILVKGDQSRTGLNLVQAKRCIQLGYRPEKIFGKGNSFQNSRVVGEVVFSGDHSILSYDKDQFVWADNGAEDAFIAKLMADPRFSSIIKASKDLKKEENADKIREKTFDNVDLPGVEAEKTKKKKDESKGKDPVVISPVQPVQPVPSSESSSPAPTPEKPADSAKPKDEPTSAPVSAPEPEKIPGNSVTVENDGLFKKLTVDVEGRKVPLYADVVEGSPDDEWLTMDHYKDGYMLHINFKNSYIAKNFTTQNAVVGSNAIALAIGASILKAQDSGLKLGNSLLLLKALNGSMTTPEKDENDN
jgi:hypothetical protein